MFFGPIIAHFLTSHCYCFCMDSWLSCLSVVRSGLRDFYTVYLSLKVLSEVKYNLVI